MADIKITDVPIFTYYNRQRFTQMGSMDCANWYQVNVPDTKTEKALYPAMGRKHIEIAGRTKLAFTAEPRFLFNSIDYAYAVIGTAVYAIDNLFGAVQIGTVSSTGNVWFDYLRIFDTTYCMMTDETNVYIISELSTGVVMQTVTDGNRPTNPYFVCAFANRFVVSNKDSSQYYVSATNLGGINAGFTVNLATVFTINGSALFNLATGTVKQIATLHNQLYIFNDFSCDIWNNLPTQITVSGSTRTFPFKLNSSYAWDYGMADEFSLSVDFGRMTWLARNKNGFVAFMTSTGDPPQDISTQAINVLLQSSGAEFPDASPFLTNRTIGFLYQYENTIFYRVSAGTYFNFGDLDIASEVSCLEYNFNSNTWSRCIELNGQRNRIERHVFFGDKHLVTVQGENTIYEMAGNIYYNELSDPNNQGQYEKFPMRYELVTKQIYYPYYAEFQTKWLEIDFVFGEDTYYKSNAPFANTVYIVDETSTEDNPVYITDENGAFLIQDGTNTPTFQDNHYNALFKPHIELFYSDDGGITFLTADVREFSQLGQYRWRMRWYQLGVSRNRVYKLVCVSPAPIVVLGAIHMTTQTSGGAM